MDNLLNTNNTESENWTEIIEPQSSIFDLRLKEVWRYRDLLFLFIRRDFVSVYKQTILGPIWHIIQPLLTTLMFAFVFGGIAGISTEGQPKVLFYMCGVTMWGYFAYTLNATANTFVNNAQIFGKVYFPRLTVPISVAISALISFAIQFVLLIAFYLYYWQQEQVSAPNIWLITLPWLLLIMLIWSLGTGIIISSLTTKYRDLRHAITFGIQLYMYSSPVIYPISTLKPELQKLSMLNPMTSVLETFRFAMLGSGTVSINNLLISTGISLVFFFIGIALFNKVEKTFMDTV